MQQWTSIDILFDIRLGICLKSVSTFVLSFGLTLGLMFDMILILMLHVTFDIHLMAEVTLQLMLILTSQLMLCQAREKSNLKCAKLIS